MPLPEKKLQAIIRAQNTQIKNLKSALKVIRTWATFEDGRYLDPPTVVRLCDKTLEKTVEGL